MRSLLALLVFIVLQILFIPLAIIGAIWTGYKQIMVSKNLGVSQTAIEIINGRWTMHIFGLRDDSGAAKLTPALPNTSTFGLWLALFPLYVYSRIAGQTRWYPAIADAGEESLANLVMNRTVYIDSIINRAKSDAEQFVVLGAGLDTRAYGDLHTSGLKFFELDQATTQQHKRKYLQKAGIDASHVQFVEVDFMQDNWFVSLEDSGYDPNKRTIFLWEGVTLYLSEASVRNTLQTIKANAVEGSIIIADIYSQRFVSGEYSHAMKASMPTLELTDEQLSFGLDMQNNHEVSLRAFANNERFTLGETYFMGHATKKGAWMVVAELTM
jgi:methyltransferase (TIGR00027 family)